MAKGGRRPQRRQPFLNRKNRNGIRAARSGSPASVETIPLSLNRARGKALTGGPDHDGRAAVLARSTASTSRMLKKSANRVLASSKSSTGTRPPHQLGGAHRLGAPYSSHRAPQRVRLGPSLAAALLDGLFEHPAWERRQEEVRQPPVVDRLIGYPTHHQACRSGVSAVAVEAFVNCAG